MHNLNNLIKAGNLTSPSMPPTTIFRKFKFALCNAWQWLGSGLAVAEIEFISCNLHGELFHWQAITTFVNRASETSITLNKLSFALNQAVIHIFGLPGLTDF